MISTSSGSRTGVTRSSASEEVGLRGGDRPVRMSPSPTSRNAHLGGDRPARMSPSAASRNAHLGGDRPVRMSPSAASRNAHLGGDRPVRMSPSPTSRNAHLGGDRPVRMSPSAASRNAQLGGDRPVRMSPSVASKEAQQLQRQALETPPLESVAPLGFYRLIGTPDKDLQEVGRHGGARPAGMSPSRTLGDTLWLRALSRPPANSQDRSLAGAGARGPAAHTRLQDQARLGLRGTASAAQQAAGVPRGGAALNKEVHGGKVLQKALPEARPLSEETFKSNHAQRARVRFDSATAAELPSTCTRLRPRDGRNSPRQPLATSGGVAPSTSDVNSTLTTPPPAPSGAAPPPAPRKCTFKRKHLGVIFSPPDEHPKRRRASSPQSEHEEAVKVPAKQHVTVGVQTLPISNGKTETALRSSNKRQGGPCQLSLPFKKRRFESLATLQSFENRPSTSQTSESAESLLRRHNQHSHGTHPRCAFIRSVLPPTPPKRRRLETPTPGLHLRLTCKTSADKKLLATGGAPPAQSLTKNGSCKRKLHLGPELSTVEGQSAFKKQKGSSGSSPVSVGSRSPTSPVTIPCLDPNDIDSVMNSQGRPVRLGSGDFGEVLLMRRKSDGSLLAVKRLKSSNCPRKAYKEMVVEIKAMIAVNGLDKFPQLVGIIDESSFAMEFVGDAKTYSAQSVHSCMLDRGILTTEDRARVSIDITRGLMALHRVGWLHNDLHNGNALVCSDPATGQPTAKIIDMGKACRISKPPPPNRFCNNVKAYYYKNCQQIAPDIVEGSSQCSEASDVYSLGTLLRDIALNIRDLKYVRNLGMRCCQKNPGRRPTLATVFGDLQKFHEKLVARKMKEAQMKKQTR